MLFRQAAHSERVNALRAYFFTTYTDGSDDNIATIAKQQQTQNSNGY